MPLLYFLFIHVALLPVSVIAGERVLSLDLCTDWMLAKYADPSQVMALSPLLHQYDIEWIGKDWITHDGSIEKILELKPDLVITGEFNALLLRQRLQELGLNVEILKLPKNLKEVTTYEQHFLSLVGQTKHHDNQRLLHSRDTPNNPRLLLLGANGIGTGRDTFEDDILSKAGWSNYIQASGYVALDLEQISTDPPDAILWSAPASAALSNLFAEHPALKKAIPEERWLATIPWKWRCPGPWTWDLIEDLQASLLRVSRK